MGQMEIANYNQKKLLKNEQRIHVLHTAHDVSINNKLNIAKQTNAKKKYLMQKKKEK